MPSIRIRLTWPNRIALRHAVQLSEPAPPGQMSQIAVSLPLGLDAREKLENWRQDYNHFRPIHHWRTPRYRYLKENFLLYQPRRILWLDPV